MLCVVPCFFGTCCCVLVSQFTRPRRLADVLVSLAFLFKHSLRLLFLCLSPLSLLPSSSPLNHTFSPSVAYILIFGLIRCGFGPLPLA
ncbi:hypothetical protein LI328DRAFT_97933 [Trichoderma asperelloides]|nr:hypothetical protein LI328DRAFT_97933 [Trichoderma asperelloides]